MNIAVNNQSVDSNGFQEQEPDAHNPSEAFSWLTRNRQILVFQTIQDGLSSSPPRTDATFENVLTAYLTLSKVVSAAAGGHLDDCHLLDLENDIQNAGGVIAPGLSSQGPNSLASFRSSTYGMLSRDYPSNVSTAIKSALNAYLASLGLADIGEVFQAIARFLSPLNSGEESLVSAFRSLDNNRKVLVFNTISEALTSNPPRAEANFETVVTAYQVEAAVIEAAREGRLTSDILTNFVSSILAAGGKLCPAIFAQGDNSVAKFTDDTFGILSQTLSSDVCAVAQESLNLGLRKLRPSTLNELIKGVYNLLEPLLPSCWDKPELKEFRVLDSSRQITTFRTIDLALSSCSEHDNTIFKSVVYAVALEKKALHAAQCGTISSDILSNLRIAIQQCGGALASGLNSEGPDSVGELLDGYFQQLSTSLGPDVFCAVLAALNAKLNNSLVADIFDFFALAKEFMEPLLPSADVQSTNTIAVGIKPIQPNNVNRQTFLSPESTEASFADPTSNYLHDSSEHQNDFHPVANESSLDSSSHDQYFPDVSPSISKTNKSVSLPENPLFSESTYFQSPQLGSSDITLSSPDSGVTARTSPSQRRNSPELADQPPAANVDTLHSKNIRPPNGFSGAIAGVTAEEEEKKTLDSELFRLDSAYQGRDHTRSSLTIDSHSLDVEIYSDGQKEMSADCAQMVAFGSSKLSVLSFQESVRESDESEDLDVGLESASADAVSEYKLESLLESESEADSLSDSASQSLKEPLSLSDSEADSPSVCEIPSASELPSSPESPLSISESESLLQSESEYQSVSESESDCESESLSESESLLEPDSESESMSDSESLSEFDSLSELLSASESASLSESESQNLSLDEKGYRQNPEGDDNISTNSEEVIGGNVFVDANVAPRDMAQSIKGSDGDHYSLSPSNSGLHLASHDASSELQKENFADNGDVLENPGKRSYGPPAVFSFAESSSDFASSSLLLGDVLLRNLALFGSGFYPVNSIRSGRIGNVARKLQAQIVRRGYNKLLDEKHQEIIVAFLQQGDVSIDSIVPFQTLSVATVDEGELQVVSTRSVPSLENSDLMRLTIAKEFQDCIGEFSSGRQRVISLLLIDPVIKGCEFRLKSEIAAISSINTSAFVKILRSLSPMYKTMLNDWIVSPGGLALGSHPIAMELGRRARDHQIFIASPPSSNLVALIELGLSLKVIGWRSSSEFVS